MRVSPNAVAKPAPGRPKAGCKRSNRTTQQPTLLSVTSSRQPPSTQLQPYKTKNSNKSAGVFGGWDLEEKVELGTRRNNISIDAEGNWDEG